MGWRKGYAGEHKAKQELIERFGKECVLKIAISQIGADFMVIKDGMLLMLVEVKETHSKYYPNRDKEQLERIKEFAKINNCLAELWIYTRQGIGKEIKKEIKIIYNPSEPLNSIL